MVHKFNLARHLSRNYLAIAGLGKKKIEKENWKKLLKNLKKAKINGYERREKHIFEKFTGGSAKTFLSIKKINGIGIDLIYYRPEVWVHSWCFIGMHSTLNMVTSQIITQLDNPMQNWPGKASKVAKFVSFLFWGEIKKNKIKIRKFLGWMLCKTAFFTEIH